MCPSSARSLRRPLVATALAGVVYVVLGAVLGGSGRLTCGVVLALVVGVAGGAVVRRGWSAGTARRSWLCFGAAGVLWAAGQLVYVASGHFDGVGTADIAFLGSVALIVVGTLLHPVITTTRLSLLRSVLDGVILVSSFLLLMTAVASAADPSGGVVTIAAMVDLVYRLADLVVFAVALLALSRMRRGNRAAVVLLAGALALFVVATDTYEQAWPFDAGWMVGFLLLWVASRARAVYEAVADPAAGVVVSGRQNVLRRVVAVLPYAAVGVTMTVGGAIYFRVHFALTGIHTVVALTMIGAMIARQTVSVLDTNAAARELARGEAYFRSIVHGSSDVTTILDESLIVRWQSPSVRTLFGFDEQLAVGKDIRRIVHRDDHAEFERALREVLDGTGTRPRTVSLRARVRDAGGRWRDVETSLANHLGNAAVHGIVLHTRDITERRALETRLEEMAFTDALTGLPNRRLFLERLHDAGVRQARTGEVYTVLAVDLDGFKAVNDLHGHGAGDALLSVVATRLRAEVRDIDTVARLGGDEFAVLVAGGAEEGHRLGERLVTTVATPYTLGQVTARVSVSVGVAEAAADDDGAVVLRNADLALRRAKATGKKRVEGYVPALHEGVLDRLALEHDLAGALERGEIRLAYQPIFDLSRDLVVGVEALMRWRHPSRGEVSPAEFIPVAEESGQIVELGRWAVHEACRQIAAWDAAGYTLQMGVNVSTRQLGTDGGQTLRDIVSSAVTASGLDPGRLVLEITESAFLDSFDTALAELEALQALGVHIALDDFGTGYSSLSYLRRLPVDILKIDREFVSGLATEDGVAALAELVVRLGERLGMEVVAEGVETPAEAAGVLGIGCVLGQGFHLGRPAAPDDLAALLADRTAGAVPGVTH